MLIFNVIFSALLVPLNLICSHWLFKEAMNLTGTTFRDLMAYLNPTAEDIENEEYEDKEPMYIPSGSKLSRNRKHYNNLRARAIARYFEEKSSNPEKSLKFFRCYMYSTLPSLAALISAEFINPNSTKYALIGNIIVLIINLAVAITGKIYKNKNPLDERTKELLEQKRQKEKSSDNRLKISNIVVYIIVGAFFIGIMSFFILGFNSMITSRQTDKPTTISSSENFVTNSFYKDVKDTLIKYNFETKDTQSSFDYVDKDKLRHTVAGTHGSEFNNYTVFEFYEYKDNETPESVYNQAVHSISPSLEEYERNEIRKAITGGEMFEYIDESGAYNIALYMGDAFIYAYSYEEKNNINEILTELGYFEKS